MVGTIIILKQKNIIWNFLDQLQRHYSQDVMMNLIYNNPLQFLIKWKKLAYLILLAEFQQGSKK